MQTNNNDILIADDERSIRLMLRTTLETSGYQVREACNSRDTLDEVRRHAPDALILDLWMPNFDGLQVLERVKGEMSGRKPSIIILTGNGTIPLTMQAIRLGASDFLHKPVTPDDLRLSVESVLDETWEVPEPPIDASYKEILRLVRRDLVRHNYHHAGELLELAAQNGRCDAEFFNLLGMLNEAEGRPFVARKFYGQAASDRPR